MTDAQVSQVATEVIRTNLAVSAQVTQLAVEVLRPNAPKGISGAVGTFTLTGNAAAVLYKPKVAGAAGSFTLSGQVAALSRTRNLASHAGAFVLTGQNAALKLPGKMLAAAGAFTLTGQSVTMKRAVTMTLARGIFTLTGYASTGRQWVRNLSGAVGSFALSGKTAVPSGAFNIADPVSGLVVLENVRGYVSPYASADEAYTTWATTLGVSSTGTDYTVSDVTTSADFPSLAAPVLDGSTYAGVNIPHSGAIALYMVPPDSTIVVPTLYSVATASVGTLTLSADRPMLIFRAMYLANMNFSQQNTNLKLRSGYNPSTGAYETIVIMTSAQPVSGLNPIRCAYRVARGLFECVITITSDAIPTNGLYFNYITTNETTSIPVEGRVLLVTSEAGTFAITSDDLSALRPIVAETIGTADVPTKIVQYSVTSTEAVAARDRLAVTWALTLTSTLDATDSLTKAYKLGPTLTEIFNLAETHIGSWKLSVLLSERTALVDAISAVFPVSITDTATLTDLVQVVRGAIIAELLRIVDPAAVVGEFHTAVIDAVLANDDLRRFLGGSLNETINSVDAVAYAPILGKVLTDTVGIADTLTQKLIIRVTADDDFNLDDSTPTKWIFKPVLTDGVEIAIGYIEPNGAFTTWAVNTRTGAVTEYQNFVFNSFAQNGHKYLGAADSGLYELDGTDDDGTDVIAHIKSGYAQFGGSKYSSFKAAYLGMRGDGNIILKLDTGDGKTYTYQTVIQDMQSTKVRLGKGLRARYFSFELISTGPDFDLDTIEFIPLVAQRRV